MELAEFEPFRLRDVAILEGVIDEAREAFIAGAGRHISTKSAYI
jgi:hypothetical protein